MTSVAKDDSINTDQHSYDFSANVSVAEIEGCGKGLLACSNLTPSTRIFTEQAISFHRSNVDLDHVTCDCCGQWLLSEREQLELAVRITSSSSSSSSPSLPPNGIFEFLDSTLSTNVVPQKCDGCHLRWCSVACYEASVSDGHQYLCAHLSRGGKLREFLAEYSTTKRVFPSTAHFGAAARILAKVAMKSSTCTSTLQQLSSTIKQSTIKPSTTKQSTTNTATSAEAINDATALQKNMKQLMGSFSQASFTDSLHATRTLSSTSMSNNTMFTEHIQPAYRTAYLESCLQILREAFAPLGEIFCQTMLSFDSFDQLIGIFATNNFGVEFVSPLVQKFQQIETLFMHSSWLSNLIQHEHFPNVGGTACFQHYALLNHSCDKNTMATCDNTKQGGLTISVETTKAINSGDEIFNCYLSQPQEMNVKERQASLCKYLFKCQCSLCVQQRLECGDDSESSSGDDY